MENDSASPRPESQTSDERRLTDTSFNLELTGPAPFF
jgi:hypothetical protein